MYKFVRIVLIFTWLIICLVTQEGRVRYTVILNNLYLTLEETKFINAMINIILCAL